MFGDNYVERQVQNEGSYLLFLDQIKKIKQYYLINTQYEEFEFRMSRRPSVEIDLSMSAHVSYSQKGANEPYTYNKYPKYFDKISSQVQDRNAFQETHYTTAQNDFSGIRKLPDNISSIRETFSYNPIPSSNRCEYDTNNNHTNQANSKLSDMLRQTMDVRSIKKKQQFNLKKNESNSLSLNQAAFIKSQNQISGQLYGERKPFKYGVRELDIKSYGHINKGYDQKHYSSGVEEQIRKIKQQRQKRKVVRQVDLQLSGPHPKEQGQGKTKQNFAKKNYIQYYTPKVQKSSYTSDFSQSNSLSPSYQRQKKQTSFDVSSQSPKKITDMKTLKDALQKKPSRSMRQDLGQKQKITLDSFVIGRSLGQGRFGTAHMAFHKSTGAIFAIKKIKKEVIKSNKLVDQFILQVKLQGFLSHPFILKIYAAFDDQTYIYLVLEFLEQGTLFNYLKKFKRLTQADAAQKIRYLAQSIKYLQDRGIAHRDIKPQNIIMTNDVCKLADFGWATFCDQKRRKTYCGTCDYVAPQILQGQEYDQTVDLWCIGVLTYELMTGKAPFYHMSMKQTKKKIINVSVTYPEDFSQSLQTFIASLIQKEPDQRMSIQEVLVHPFIKNIKLSQ